MGEAVKRKVELTRGRPVERLEIIAAYLQFLRQQKKWWMFPMVLLLMLLGMLVGLTQGSPLAPFIYTVV